MLRRFRWLLSIWLVTASSAHAAQWGLNEALSLDAHGFVSQGFLYTTHQNAFLAKWSTRGSLEFSEVGINFTKPLTDKLRVGLQLFSRDLGAVGNYSIKADWYYVDYRWQNWLGVRVGRVKLPFGLYNDTSDIDAARVPVLLPQSIYPIENREYLLAQTGGEVYGFLSLGAGGALDYRLYAGTIYFQIQNQPGLPYTLTDLANPYTVGGRLLWETPVSGLRFGGSLQMLRLDTTLVFSGSPSVSVAARVPATLWVASAEYAGYDWLATLEYSRWRVSTFSADPLLVPSSSVVSERAYAMLSYRVKPWLHPGIYYSVLFPDVNNRKGREAVQHDVAFTFRFDLNSFWLIKAEAHYMNGTAALLPALNDGRPRDALARQWALIVLKTTAYF